MKKDKNMETIKESKLKINALVAILALTIVISSICLFAWAKYKSSLEGSTNSQIAQWSFKVRDGITQTENIENLSVTRMDTNKDVKEGFLAPRNIW